MRSRCCGRQGAMVKPQLPITTVVTPSAADGVANGIPGELGVVVRVDVHDAGSEDATARVYRLARGAQIAAAPVRGERGDAAALDTEAALARGGAEAVDDAGVREDEIEHGCLLHITPRARRLASSSRPSPSRPP